MDTLYDGKLSIEFENNIANIYIHSCMFDNNDDVHFFLEKKNELMEKLGNVYIYRDGLLYDYFKKFIISIGNKKINRKINIFLDGNVICKYSGNNYFYNSNEGFLFFF